MQTQKNRQSSECGWPLLVQQCRNHKTKNHLSKGGWIYHHSKMTTFISIFLQSSLTLLFNLHTCQVLMKNILLLAALLFVTACGFHNTHPYHGNAYDFYDVENPNSLSTNLYQSNNQSNDNTNLVTHSSRASDTQHGYRSSRSYYTPSYNKPVKVRGYYRKNGTYVKPHTRSRPKSR